MSFLPPDLDVKAASAGLLSQDLPSQVPVARSFSDPSYLMEINDLRAKVKAGTATKDDMKRIIALIRETRGAVSQASAVKPKRAPAVKKAAAAKPDGQALLDML